MWAFFNNIAQWPLWSFLSVVLVVLITQRFIATRERRNRIKGTQLELYLSTITPLCDLYQAALDPNPERDSAKLHRDIFEMAARYSIMGSNAVMETFGKYSTFVITQIQQGTAADERILRKLASNVTCAMCCDIHNEPYREDLSGGANQIELGEFKGITTH